MKTFLLDAGYMFDPEDLSLERISTEREGIRSIHVAPEECIVKYGDEEKKAKKGDIIITFYESVFPQKFIIVKSKDWRNNIEAYNKKLQKDKEEWAVKQCECVACEDCCEACND